MNSTFNLIIFTGFILIIVGGFMETQRIGSGNFVSGFGSGMLAAGVLQLIYRLIQQRKAKQAI